MMNQENPKPDNGQVEAAPRATHEPSPGSEDFFLNPEELNSSQLTIMPAYEPLSLDSEESSKWQELPESQAQCFGYRYYLPKVILWYTMNICLLGAPYVFGRWYCRFKIAAQCVPECLRRANVVLVKDSDDRYFMVDVHEDPIKLQRNEITVLERALLSRTTDKKRLRSLLQSSPVVRNFIFHHEKYVWDDIQKQFRRIEGLDGYTCNGLLRIFQGHSDTRLEQMRTIYGQNIIEVEVKGIHRLLVDEILNPFYFFQAFSVCLWILDDYVIYAICICIISSISISTSIYETRTQQVKVRNMAVGEPEGLLTVRRANEVEVQVSPKDLVPGDIIVLRPDGCVMPCDAVLINGSCIVNESMLTGESVPVNKAALSPSDEIYNSETLKRSTLYAGTKVIQTRFYEGRKVACLVVRTGFNTQKGSLIRSILFPKEAGLHFYHDAMRFIQFLFGIASIGMMWSVYMYIDRGASLKTVIVRVLDIATIVVPPALPAAMTVGVVYAQSRLKRKNIFCISPQRINFCGQINLICFDKTGTLTEEGLDLWCVVACEEKEMKFLEPIADPSVLPDSNPLMRAMASCHSLTYVNGVLIGDPLDLKMFSSTKWVLEEPQVGTEITRFDVLVPNVVKTDSVELGILRDFEFTPQLQRMSVVVRDLTNPQMFLHCKGSPEKVSSLCLELPDDYERVLDSFTVKGYRVLALAWKPIEELNWHHVQRTPRDELESGLRFGGFLVMQNSLKKASNPVIEELSTANIRSLMVTGDNLLTAISVARECGMIPSCDKVIVVHTTEEGEVQYKLAAHHLEPLESPQEETNSQDESSISPINGAEVDDVELDGNLRSRKRRISSQSNRSAGPDALIDMDRLVKILPNKSTSTSNVAQVIIDLHESNYHFVLTGKTWDVLREKCPRPTFEKILAKGTVFARMSPESKRELVEELQGIGYIVSMCGDGANDCAALKMAHVGISLSEAEASVAAPFTSSEPNISCVPNLIREGRCAMATSFGMFKYMALYSLMQFTSVLLLYHNFTNFDDAHFLYIDLAITTTIALLMGRTGPYEKIAPKPPAGRLVTFQNICSLLAQVIWAVLIQFSALFWLQQQSWYVPVANKMTDADDLHKLCWETTTIVSVTSFQYLIICFIFYVGPPYRKPIYSNVLLLLDLIVLLACSIFLVVYPVGFVGKLFQLMPVEDENINFRLGLLLFPVINFSIAFLLEKNMSSDRGLAVMLAKALGREKTKEKYEEIRENLSKDAAWPPIIP